MGTVTMPEGRVVAEVRSVNGRTLDVRVKLPEALTDISLFAEQQVRRRLRRGRVELAVRTEGSATVPYEVDPIRARAALESLGALARSLGHEASPPLSLLASVPGLFVPAARDLSTLREAAERAIDAGLADLDADRAREGAALATELGRRVAEARTALARIADRAPLLPAAFRARITERLARLDVGVGSGDGAGARLEPGRLEAEVALLADRADVREEVARLETHLGHFLSLVETPAADERHGKRLDFLTLEMMREIGTIGQKCQDAMTSRDVVTLKVEIERMREQVQNVE